MSAPQPLLHLGIDTGGTFTDGVLLQPETKQVIRSAKVLTTHQDLKICLAQILEVLLPEDPAAISLVSISTTLATNAIAEGKRKPVALLLVGYDADLVRQFNFHRQFGTPHYFFVDGRHDLDGIEQVALDEATVERIARQVQPQVEAFAVTSYAGPMNNDHEQRAADILLRTAHLPVVQAHHLSNELDSIRRATTASLNASLLANTQEFIEAVQSMLANKGLTCPVMMVRGDGSLAKVDFARQRPVEIIHSGPATSAIGGRFLARVDAALIVDMGGTTTDLCVVAGEPIHSLQNGASVGPYRTCVRTIQARSLGLGGDSRIRFDHHHNLSVGPERVVPLAHLCQEYPEIQADLLAWLRTKGRILYSDELEYWILRREPSRPLHNLYAQKALACLRRGPQRMRQLVKDVGARSPVSLDMDELVNQEIIVRASLTPTDLLHVSGEYAPWDIQAAQAATLLAAKIWQEEAPDFVRRVKAWMTRRLVAEIIQYLSGQALSEAAVNGQRQSLDRWMYEQNLAASHPYLGCKLFLKIPLVGIGAPAGVFLAEVARALGTDFILPAHYEVANAVGTVVGHVMVQERGLVFPCIEGAAITGTFARVANHQKKFEHYDQALAFTRQALLEQVTSRAQAAGAGAITVEYQEKELMPGMLDLLAWGVGKPA